MSRSATPTEPAVKHTNGNGHSANGHGTGAKRTGYRQLKPGETKTWKGLSIERRYSRAGVDPYDTVEWETREAVITNEHGKTVFEQKNLEFPKAWSQLATQVTASKYFRGHLGTPERENSVRQMIGRVADTITGWGEKDHYFATDEDRQAFHAELTDILLKQRAAFNSPVWFNVGIDEHPQCSACFINSVADTMDSILTLAHTEGMLFKYGSGTGSNLSTLRSKTEGLRGGGSASGPVSFMKGFDAFAGVIKSGGKTRRAAKMVILNVDHPDVQEFIECKLVEERKAWALIDAGYDGNFNGGAAYESVFFQNSNNSVRVTDAYMEAVEKDGDWTTHAVTTGKPMETFKARYLLNKMAEAAWVCGDPGIQYHDTVNRWHTSANTAPINASNPCSEYMFLDDSACNLASLNLMKFVRDDGEFDVEAYKHAVRIVLTAQEILVDNASYPTPKIGENSHNFRPLGLGYANLGALLLSMARPYDSPEGRDMAGAVTALMCGEAYAQSARIAERMGAFPGYEVNREPMLEVIRMHREAMRGIQPEHVQPELFLAAQESWDTALDHGEKFGFKNSQVTVLAPTGTIGFMMDCDTTGIEPDLALVKYKRLVGGGLIKIVNNTVPQALMKLGYTPEQSSEIVSYIDKNGKIEGARYVKEEHLAVFDCSLAPQGGGRSIRWTGHVKMMAAAQPFLSGAISKTINMPEEATVEDIMNAYIESWRLGLKAVAIYRDNSKRSQPLSAAKDAKKEDKKTEAAPRAAEPVQRELFQRAQREKMPYERASVTHKFSVSGHEGYITVGMYDDGRPGEVFIKMAKEGSTLSGVMDGLALTISLGLQYGVPLKVFVDKLLNTRFEPSGITANPNIRFVSSVLDYIARWLGGRFISSDYLKLNGGTHAENSGPAVPAPVILSALASPPAPAAATKPTNAYEGAPTCSECGMLMVPNGACYKCENCGSTSGCS